MPDMTGRSRGINYPDTLIKKYRRVSSDVNATPIKPMMQWIDRKGDDHITGESSEEADLRQAIALSLQDDNVIHSRGNNEVSDITRALNSSMFEEDGDRLNVGSSGTCVVSDPDDPSTIIRQDMSWPVGLANVGNTCWFNVVIQSLFHLPYFRQLVLTCQSHVASTESSEKSKLNVRLLEEVRSLFAVMYTSKCKHVDPSKCVKILKDSFMSRNAESQQDVSEFIHLLLDAFEDVFRFDFVRQLQHNKTSVAVLQSPAHESNGLDGNMEMETGEGHHQTTTAKDSLLDLFYGTYKTVGQNNGNFFEHNNKFGILPVCVDGSKDLHDSLHHYTTRSQPTDGFHAPAHQNVWFTKLPPVLIFQLSRFHFNQLSARTEKLHNKIAFPFVLYMDRYLESNREAVRPKHEALKFLNQQLVELKMRLSSLMQFQSSSGKSHDVIELLSACAEFVSQRGASCRKGNPASSSSSSLSSLSSSSRRRVGSGSPTFGLSRNKRVRENLAADADDDGAVVDGTTQSPYFRCSSSSAAAAKDEDLDEAVDANDDDRMTASRVETALRKWKGEVDKEVAALRRQISDTEKEMERMFDEACLHRRPYSLHAVLVHQGQAIAGHYWAYVRDHVNQRWLKFNDLNVSDATVEELTYDCVGGCDGDASSRCNPLASAYCLIYVDSKRTDLFNSDCDMVGLIRSDIKLYETIQAHNRAFDRTLDDVEVKKAKVISTNFPSSSQTDPSDDTSKAEVAAANSGADDVQTFNLSDLMNAIDNASKVCDGQAPEKALGQAVEWETNRLRQLAAENVTVTSDLRLQNIVVYLLQNGASNEVIDRLVLVQFTDKRLRFDTKALEVRRCARERLTSLPVREGLKAELKMWEDRYRTFCAAAAHTVEGLHLFTRGKHYDAVRHFSASLVCNDKLVNDETQERCGIDTKLVNQYFRTCVQQLHDNAYNKVLCGETPRDAQEGLELMRRKLIPATGLLLYPKIAVTSSSTQAAHLKLADSIRDDWCSLFEKQPAVSREELSSALTEFLDLSPSSQKLDLPSITITSDLYQRYERIMTTLLQLPA